MTKDAYYFSHDANARNDQKLLAVRMKYGMRGYGIYFGIIEIMREANAYQLPNDYQTLAYDLREPAEDIKEIVTGFDLFVLDDGFFYSESLSRRMGHLDRIKTKRSEAGRIGGLASASKRQANVDDRSSSKVKQSKVNKVYIPTGIPPTLETVLEVITDRVEAARFCDFYGSKGWVVGKVKMKDWRAAARNWLRNGFGGKNGVQAKTKTKVHMSVEELEAQRERHRKEDEAQRTAGNQAGETLGIF